MKRLLLVLLAISPTSVFAQHDHDLGAEAKKSTVMVEKGLGRVHHPVSTKNASAQQFFNQGLAYIYAFNHQEAISSFKHAAELDPDLAMA